MTVEDLAEQKGKKVEDMTLEEKREAHAAVVHGGEPQKKHFSTLIMRWNQNLSYTILI